MHQNNHDGDDDNDADDGSDTASDTSDDVVEVPPDEIPDYFEERGGRLFHSHGGCPYPLPVDAEEQRRQTGLHELLRELLGEYAVGTNSDVLARTNGEQRRVLDLGTGTGQWVLDMAQRFPHARFYGVDIVPIATRYPPRNVFFELHDIKDQFRFGNSTIDLVHARSISMAIRDYGALLPEIARLLRRGGLFVSCEWRRWPALADGSDIATHAPRTHAFFAVVRDTLRERRGIQPVAPHIPQLLAQSGWFTNIVVREHFMPIGEWHTNPTMRALGGQYREMVATYARSMRALLVEGGHAAHADDLVEGYITETWEVSGLYSTCFTIHARRV